MLIKEKFDFGISKLLVHGYKIDCGKEIRLTNVSSIERPKDNTLMFITNWNEKAEKSMSERQGCLLLVREGVEPVKNSIMGKNQFLFVANPRLEYAKILAIILNTKIDDRRYSLLDNYITIGQNTLIGKGTVLEPNTFIDHDVEIGENCTIRTGARINRYVTIGSNCVVGSNSVIGAGGFGYERGADNIPYKIPQLGGVTIGSNVEIGCLNTICSGTMEPGKIDDYVKIDDRVHIGHNCTIGTGTLLAVGSVLCGSVNIGENVWVGPGCVLSDHVEVGKNSSIGIGSVVIESIPDNSSVCGYYALEKKISLKNYQRLKGSV